MLDEKGNDARAHLLHLTSIDEREDRLIEKKVCCLCFPFVFGVFIAYAKRSFPC